MDWKPANNTYTSTYIRPKIKTREELKQRILQLLGYSLVTAELTEEMLDMCIDEATELYTKYCSFPEKYLIVNLKDRYIPNVGISLAEENVAAAYGVEFPGGNFGSLVTDTIWSIPNALMASGAYPFFGAGGTGAGNWVTYHAAVEWLHLSKRMVGGVQYEWDPYTQTLKLIPEPENLDKSILVKVEVIPSDEYLYGNEYVKRIAVAKAKILLGTIRKKFSNLSLLGGGTVDTTIGDEGKEELDTILENIRTDESRGNGFIIG